MPLSRMNQSLEALNIEQFNSLVLYAFSHELVY